MKNVIFLLYICSITNLVNGQNSSLKLEQILNIYGVKNLNNYDAIVVNTKLGCPDCSESVNNLFLDENFIEKKLLIVTSMTPKVFAIKFSKVLSKRKKRVLLDTKGLCYKYGLVYDVPKVFFLREGKVISEKSSPNVKSIF